MVTRRVRNIWSVIFLCVLFAYASPVYAHGGVEFVIGIFIVWVLIPLLLYSLIVFPIILLFGKIFQLKRKLVVVISVALSVLIYIITLPNLKSIIKWLIDLQYIFD